jgi:hypothetical protein
MIFNLDRELTVVRLVKCLTDAVKRMGHGAWLSDPAVTFLRTELYSRDGINGWTAADDRVAAQRLKTWVDRVWEKTT